MGPGAAILLCALCLLCAAVSAAVPPPARTLYTDALAREQLVRAAMTAENATAAVLDDVRAVVAAYEAVMKTYPKSGYSDNSLWQAGILALDAFIKFNQPADRETGVRILQGLTRRYPGSRLAQDVPARLASLESTTLVVPEEKVVASTKEARPPAPSPAAPSAAAPSAAAPSAVAPAPRLPLAAIKDIRRTVLPDAVRITIELDSEVPFRDERIADPSRVFVDLPGTRAAAKLIDRTLPFESDADILRQVRVGRHPNSTTRVVLDVAGVSEYSVYPLYNPFRLIIDCVRAPELTAVDAAAKPRPASVEKRAAPEPARTSPAAPIPPLEIARPVPEGTRAAPEAARAVPEVARPGPERSSPPVAPRPPVAKSPPYLTARRLATTSMRTMPSMSSRHVTVLAELHEIDNNVLGISPNGAAAAPPLAAETTLQAKSITGAAPPLPPLPAQKAEATKAGSSRASGEAAAPAAVAPKPPADLPSRNLTGGLSMARQLGLGVSRIVIDPGHGGHDPGATGKGVSEAELVLDVALRLEQLLQKQQGVEVILTRRTDEFIPLPERTAIANREGADLFLSIHANASNNLQARGVETYFLNFAQNLSTAAVAARENAASAQLMGALPDFVKAIALNNKLDESRDFATFVQQAMVARLKTSNKTLRNLGVKQAPFVVLIGAAMPSVLAEISFVTNPQEARLLKGNAYRQRIAEALFNAIKKYQASLKDVTAVALQ